jgi:hypothetical protein
MLIDTWATVQKLMEDTGLSADEILRMDADEYARLTGRPTPAQAAITALGYDEPVPGTPRQQAPQPLQEPQQIDLANLTMEQYGALRGQLGVRGREYGRGALDGGSTADWIAAAQRKAGRAAMQAGNVQEAAQPDSSKYLTRNEPVTGRASFYRGN